MKHIKHLIKVIEINHFTTQRTAAIAFFNELCRVYNDTEFQFIHSGDCYYICGEIWRPNETIEYHKYQIEYFANHLGCTKYNVDSVFNEADNSAPIYRNVV